MHPHHHFSHDHCAHRHDAARRGSGFDFSGAFDEAFGNQVRRRFDGDDLRLLILHLIENEPRHGYDVIKAVEALSNGAYSPSPGVVYPALTFLEEAGFATGSTEANRKAYAITEDGRTHLEEHREELDIIIGKLRILGRRYLHARQKVERRIVRLRRQLGEEEIDEVEGATDIAGVLPEVNDARRALKQAIRAAVAEGEDEQRRLAGILRKAAAEIAPGDIDLG